VFLPASGLLQSQFFRCHDFLPIRLFLFAEFDGKHDRVYSFLPQGKNDPGEVVISGD
jgi:hypothetical protein